MTLHLDPAIEQRIQRQLEQGRFHNPAEVINHALDLIEAEALAEDWLLQNKEAINRGLDESFAAKERGESYSPDQAEAILDERRASRNNRAA